jgi:hypothetical protein
VRRKAADGLAEKPIDDGNGSVASETIVLYRTLMHIGTIITCHAQHLSEPYTVINKSSISA